MHTHTQTLMHTCVHVDSSACMFVPILTTCACAGPGHTIVTILCDSGFRYVLRRASSCVCVCVSAYVHTYTHTHRYGSKLFNRKWLEEKDLLKVVPQEYHEFLI